MMRPPQSILQGQLNGLHGLRACCTGGGVYSSMAVGNDCRRTPALNGNTRPETQPSTPRRTPVATQRVGSLLTSEHTSNPVLDIRRKFFKARNVAEFIRSRVT